MDGQADPARASALPPGALVLDGRFRIVRVLGGGGMGKVYLAEQVSLGRKVAIKVLRKELGLQPGMEERFRREALLLSSVDHPAVVRVIDFGQANGATCLVMDLVEGETLEVALRQGPLPVERALMVLHQLAQGLSAIHARDIVHRDLKPDNVMLARTADGEQAKLLDFGIARLSGADGNVTQVGTILGTPEYLSPEQAQGQRLDARSDIYSFGTVAYRALSGTLPFPGPSPSKFVVQHIQSPPRPLREAAPSLGAHKELCTLVMRCLAKDPAKRPATAQALATALARLRGVPTPTPIALPAHRAPAPVPAPSGAPAGDVPASSGTNPYGAVPAPDAPPPDAPPASPPPVARGQSGLKARVPGAGPFPLGKLQNLTVMLTDLKGFTERTSQQSREANARMLRQHDALLVRILKRHHGRLVQKRGDALLATFHSPTESVHCGMAMQDALWRFNQGRPEADQLHVRVCIHAGEVMETADGLVGEPMNVVTAVESVAEAGQVVFTESVFLSMNRAEVTSEPWTPLDLPGRDEKMRLHRCQAAPEGPPFGGRDTPGDAEGAGAWSTLRAGLDHALAWLLSLVREALALLRAPGVRGRIARRAGAAAAVLLLGAVVGLALYNEPERQARRLIRQRRASEALQLVAEGMEKDPSPALRMLRASALHSLDRHDHELAAIAELAGGKERVEPLLLEGLAEDFAEKERLAIREALERLPVESALSGLQELAHDGSAKVRWGALRLVDMVYDGQGLPLVRLYSEALEQADCRVRNLAVRRLGALKDPAALPALQKLRDTPKRPGLLIPEDCGQDQAAAAIRAIQRENSQ